MFLSTTDLRITPDYCVTVYKSTVRIAEKLFSNTLFLTKLVGVVD